MTSTSRRRSLFHRIGEWAGKFEAIISTLLLLAALSTGFIAHRIGWECALLVGVNVLVLYATHRAVRASVTPRTMPGPVTRLLRRLATLRIDRTLIRRYVFEISGLIFVGVQLLGTASAGLPWYIQALEAVVIGLVTVACGFLLRPFTSAAVQQNSTDRREAPAECSAAPSSITASPADPPPRVVPGIDPESGVPSCPACRCKTAV